ncbi:MAG: hypothetical protein FWD53_09340, partial [Phycisphaerales bacterium]|nr:hypothetical protein [Phycisphaerales bacterium]
MKRVLLAMCAGMLLAGCATQQVQVTTVPLEGTLPNGSLVLNEPVLEHPTLRSLGAYWIIQGDENKNATVSLEYRALSDKENVPPSPWVRGHDFLRVEKGSNDKGAPSKRQENTKLPIPADSWLFAGSALLLKPDTTYELKLTLRDPDGGFAERVLKSRTIAEPVMPMGNGMKAFYVEPGNGGGTGTIDDPFKGIAAANAKAEPGSLFMLRRGIYPPAVLTRSGEPGKPIVWKGTPGAIIRGEGPKQTPRGLDMSNLNDVWLENVTTENA